MGRPYRQFRHSSGLGGLLVAVIAMMGQLVLGAMVLPDGRPADPVAALAAMSVLCQHGNHAGGPPAPARDTPQATLCPLCGTLALASAIPVPAALLPAPPLAPVLRGVSPGHARAPPGLAVASAYPRGPPVAG